MIRPPGLNAEQKAKVNGIGTNGGIGQTATLLYVSGGGSVTPGSIISGNSLRYCGVGGPANGANTPTGSNWGATPQGTWMVQGHVSGLVAGSLYPVTSFVRID